MAVADAPPIGGHGARRFLAHLAAMVALMYAGMLALDPLYAGWLTDLAAPVRRRTGRSSQQPS
jgi:hypothetical protein